MRDLKEKTQQYTVGSAFTTTVFNNVVNSLDANVKSLYYKYLESFSALGSTKPMIVASEDDTNGSFDRVALNKDTGVVKLIHTNPIISGGGYVYQDINDFKIMWGLPVHNPNGYVVADFEGNSFCAVALAGTKTYNFVIKPDTAQVVQPGDRFTKDVLLKFIVTTSSSAVTLTVDSDYTEAIQLESGKTLTYNKLITITIGNTAGGDMTALAGSIQTALNGINEKYLVSAINDNADLISGLTVDAVGKTFSFYSQPLQIHVDSTAVAAINEYLTNDIFVPSPVSTSPVLFIRLPQNTISGERTSLLGKYSVFDISSANIVLSSSMSTNLVTGSDEGALIPLFARYGAFVYCLDGSVIAADQDFDVKALNGMGDIYLDQIQNFTWPLTSYFSAVDPSNLKITHDGKQALISTLSTGSLNITIGDTTGVASTQIKGDDVRLISSVDPSDSYIKISQYQSDPKSIATMRADIVSLDPKENEHFLDLWPSTGYAETGLYYKGPKFKAQSNVGSGAYWLYCDSGVTALTGPKYIVTGIGINNLGSSSASSLNIYANNQVTYETSATSSKLFCPTPNSTSGIDLTATSISIHHTAETNKKYFKMDNLAGTMYHTTEASLQNDDYKISVGASAISIFDKSDTDRSIYLDSDTIQLLNMYDGTTQAQRIRMENDFSGFTGSSYTQIMQNADITDTTYYSGNRYFAKTKITGTLANYTTTNISSQMTSYVSDLGRQYPFYSASENTAVLGIPSTNTGSRTNEFQLVYNVGVAENRIVQNYEYTGTFLAETKNCIECSTENDSDSNEARLVINAKGSTLIAPPTGSTKDEDDVSILLKASTFGSINIFGVYIDSLYVETIQTEAVITGFRPLYWDDTTKKIIAGPPV